MRLGLLALLLNVLYYGILLHDHCLHVGEKLRQLYHLALNLLDRFVPVPDSAEHLPRFAAAVASHELCILHVSALPREYY